MTTKQRHHRRQAAVAIASLTAGTLAAGLAIYVEAVPYAFAREPTPVADRDAPLEAGTTAIQQWAQYLPMLDGRAVSNVAELDLAPMKIVVGHSPSQFEKADFASKPACQPYWRDLDSGPVGRHVLVTCPGVSYVPPEPVSMLSNSGKLQLPTVATFNGQLPRLQLPADLLPSARRAEVASLAVEGTLNHRWQSPRSGADGDTGEVARLPLQNPLSWTPTGRNAS